MRVHRSLRAALIVFALGAGLYIGLSGVGQVYAYPYSWWGSSWGCPYSYFYSWYCPYYSYYYPYYYGSYSYPYSYGYSFYTQPTQVQLTMNVNPSSLQGAVNFTGAGAYNQGSAASFSASQSIIQVSQNTRYVFSGWTGDYSGQGLTGTVTMDSAKTLTAVYQIQYYLTVNSPSNLPPVQGSGWYNATDSATLTVQSLIVGDTESRSVFTGWILDGTNGPATATMTIRMGAPHTVSAVYKQQYYLTVRSDQGGVTSGSGWYDAGTQAQISASTPPNPAYGITMIFNGWNGTVTSPANQSTTVLMNAPKTVTATWRTDPTILYGTVTAVAAVIAVAAYLITRRPARSDTKAASDPSRSQVEPPKGDV